VYSMKRLRNAQYLNRYPFLVLTDDLFTGCPLHKYVNDTTLSELVQPKQLDTHILTYLADLLTWAAWGAGTISGQCGQIFVEKIRRKAPKKIAFAHPRCQFAHPGFNKMGGQKPSCDYLNKSSLKSSLLYLLPRSLALRTLCICNCLY